MPSVPHIYDLIVIGAGPAGASAAITAAGSGARVLLLERGQLPRHKVCGEFVSAESLGLLLTLLDSDHRNLLEQAIRIPRSQIFLDGYRVRASIDPPAASIARFDLDIALWESAASAGVHGRLAVAVEKIERSSPLTNIFQVKTTDGDFESKTLIDATGRWSNLNAAHARNGSVGQKWLGLKGHFSEPPGEKSVDLYFFDGGYCGVQPVELSESGCGSDRVNACAVVRADVANSLSEVFAQHAGLHERSRRWLSLSDAVSTAPLIFRKPQPVQNGVVRAGDAAAFVDPFVGDGISLALRSGRLAAQALSIFLQKKGSYDDAARHYQRAYEKQFGAIFRTSSKIRQVLSLPKALRTPLLFMLERSPAATRYLIRKTR
jgi:flavin-dependent dehydrogenase